MSEKETMIRLEGIKKRFRTKAGELEVLHGVSADIKKGEVFGIIGLSGAGKSTLVRCINMLERPTEGKVYFEGRDMGALSQGQLNIVRRSMGMIFQQFNHPSVAVWGIFFDQTPRGDDPTAYVKELNSLAMLEDPSRLTSATSNQDGKINFVTDLVVWDHNYGWKEGLPSDIKVWLDQLRTNWGSLCSGISYGAGASIYHQDDSLYRPDYLGNWHPERWQTYLHEQYYPYIDGSPFLWGWFVANMFDYGAAGRNWGEGTGVDDRGLVTFDRKYRKDAFYFYKANWNRTEPTVWIAEKRWNRRPRTTQTVRVYSNADQVELWLNGASLGAKTGTNGTFVWEGVEMRRGANRLQARTNAGEDEATVYIR